jgi:hypothetical protein
MARIVPERMTASIDGEFVVFLIGMRINKLWKIHKWLPVFLAMPKMLREVNARKEVGFLGSMSAGLMIVQYWRSFDDLERYARSRDHLHWPAWVAFNKRTAASRGDVGIWHETYCVGPGKYEAVYSGMPPTGLAAASTMVPASARRESARGRLTA